MDVWAVGVAACGIFLVAALGQAVTGFGFSIIAMPMLVLVEDARSAVVSATVVGMLLGLRAVYGDRRHVEWPVVRGLALASVAGLPVGLLLLAVVDAGALKIGIAVVVLLTVALLLLGLRLPIGRGATGVAGFVSGFLQTSTGMGGPPLVLALQARGMRPIAFRTTLMATSLVQAVVALGGFVALGFIGLPVIVSVAGGVAGVPLGWRAGDWIFSRIRQERFRYVVLAGLVVTATVTLAAAIGG